MKLSDIATVVRSANAGASLLTIDITLPNAAAFEAMRSASWCNAATIAGLYRVDPEQVELHPFPPVRSLKITLPRWTVSGSFEDSDVDGCQQHAPLLDLEVDVS